MARYREEKEQIADAVIATLEKRFPGLTNQIEMYDVATPITYFRYTGNWQGTYQGWLATPKTPMTFLIKKTLPGLDNFYMAGALVYTWRRFTHCSNFRSRGSADDV
jgi:phytoene dehydrogenase-like protein